MNPTQIAENYWVSPQLELDQVAQVKADGFDVIVCNRPDGEGPGQPSSADMSVASAAAGIEFEYLPMAGPNFSADQAEKVKALNASGKKVFAYCRSGNRSSILFNAALA